ncbi:MAG: hypothetical protein ACI8UO_005617 [Verrucomicrobiales bacterium]|jgi:hypothetical protein
MITSKESTTRGARSLQLQRLVSTSLLVLFLGHLLTSRIHGAEDQADPYDALYDVIMTRFGPDGKSYAENESTPAIFAWSEFPFDDKTFKKFDEALDAFGALPQEKIEEYSDVKRALLQRHLWKVFDATFPFINWKEGYYWSGRTRFPKTHMDRREAVQPRIATLIQRLALTKEQIQALPNTMAATVESGDFEESHDPADRFKRFLPGDPYSKESPWFCMSEAGDAIPASVHTGERQSRSMFLSFMRLPGGRIETRKYVENLKKVAEVFPVGTQFALIEQAFLISDEGELILSPLIVSIQLRAYLDLERSANAARPDATQCLAEFVMQPRQLMQGNAVMKAMKPDDRRFEAGDEDCQLSGGPHDPFEGRMPATTRLNLCMACHAGAPAKSAHAVLTTGFSFNRKASLHIEEGSPAEISKATSAQKRDSVAWKTLHGLWRADTGR